MAIQKDESITFSLKIEELVAEKNIPYMDAILLYCHTSGLEIEVAAKLISSVIKSKLKIEAEDLNFMKKSSTLKLPI